MRRSNTVVNPRLLRIKERTLARKFDVVYVPGGRQAAADTLSRKKSGVVVLAGLVENMDREHMMVADMMISLTEVSAVAEDKDKEVRGLGGARVGNAACRDYIVRATGGD